MRRAARQNCPTTVRRESLPPSLCVPPCICAQCELDIMFNLEKAHFILDEMVMNGCIIETNKNNVLAPVQLLDKTS